MGKLALSHIAGGDVKWTNVLEEIWQNVSRTIKKCVSCDPVISLLEIYSTEIAQNVGKDTSYSKIFITAETGNNQND